jgi:membrane protease subunit (stomatin/prohibitin family)
MYVLVVGSSALELAKKVNEMIKEGWKPIGGVAVDNVCYQAMIKEQSK